MSDRRKAGSKNRVMAYIAAAVVHLLVIAALLYNFSNNEPRETIDAFEAEKIDTVKASVIDESQIKDQQEKLKKADLERERKKREEKQRQQDELKKIQQQSDQEQQKVIDLQDKQKLEKEKLESQRKAIALKKKKDEARRKKNEKIAKQKEEAEKKRIAELKKQVAREEEDLRERQRINKLLAEEEAERLQLAADRRAKERTTTVMSQYSAKIEQAIKDKWRVAPGTESWRVAKINIKLSPDGQVLKVVVINSSGSQDYDRSVETAVLQASPLPFPTVEEDPSAHQVLQDININLKQ
ncbi:MAG: colicin import membrane protein [Arenicella sp.]|jgi:colicin import membrane protein